MTRILIVSFIALWLSVLAATVVSSVDVERLAGVSKDISRIVDAVEQLKEMPSTIIDRLNR